MGLFGALKRLVTGKPVLRRTVVVVEIGPDWVKAVEARPKLIGRQLCKVACRPLPEGRAAAETIAALFGDQHYSRSSVVTSLPRQLVTVRSLRVPATDPDEVTRMVKLQMGRQTPYSKEEVVTDFKVIGQDEQGFSTVLLAIARRSVIMERLEALDQASVRVDRVALGTEGLIERFADVPGLSRSDVLAVLDVDANYTDFAVLNRGGMVFSRSILIGGAQLEADPQKWQHELAKEIEESLSRYRSEHGQTQISKLVLAGCPLGVEQLHELLASNFEFPVEILGAVSGVRVRGGKAAMDRAGEPTVSFSALLGVAVGCDDLEIDLMLPERAVTRHVEERKRQLNLLGLLGLAIVTLVSIVIFSAIFMRYNQLLQLTDLIEAEKPVAAAVENDEQQLRVLGLHLDARGTPITLWSEITKLTPDEVYLNYLRINAKSTVVLSGRSETNSDVFKYVTALDTSPLLANVKATYTARKKDPGGEFTEFEIRCEYEPPEAASSGSEQESAEQ